jgi:hypothetical protein
MNRRIPIDFSMEIQFVIGILMIIIGLSVIWFTKIVITYLTDYLARIS